MSAIQAQAQSPNPGEIISLFRVDATPVGGNVYFVCMASQENAGVRYGGQEYTPVDCEFSGLETNAQGTLPTPRLKIANTNGVWQQIMNTYGDMIGCEIRRVRTFRRFLDGQPEADPSAYFGPDVFRVERLTSQNPIYVEWELSAAIDQEGKMLPGRVVVRDTCLWRYRSHVAGGTFDYSRATCPYTGSACFDPSGASTTPDKDRCGRKISDCKLRFGADQPLPFGGFPGVARVRQ